MTSLNFRKINIEAYKPGRSILKKKKNVIKLSANESALGKSPKVLKILKSKNVTIVNCTHDPYSFDSVDKYFKIVTENEKRKIIELNGI